MNNKLYLHIVIKWNGFERTHKKTVVCRIDGYAIDIIRTMVREQDRQDKLTAYGCGRRLGTSGNREYGSR